MSAPAPPGAGATATVTVPASSANLGPGFDTVGLALGLRDRYAVTVTGTPGLSVTVTGEGVDELPRDESHLVARCLREALASCGLPWVDDLARHGLGLELSCRNAIPMSAGLGSSAAAGVGGFGLGFALARGGALTAEDLALVNTHAGVLEGHPDNSSASVYGGLTVSWMPSPSTVRTARPVVHRDLEPVVLVPTSDRLGTHTARAVLPPVVPFADTVAQTGRAALLVHALTADLTLIFDATEDRIHQEPRRAAYPGSMAAVDALRALGHAAVISGAGPAVLVLGPSDRADAVVAEVRSWGRDWRALRPGVDHEGLRAG